MEVGRLPLLPYDCMCETTGFIEKQEDFMALMEVCHEIRNVLESKDHISWVAYNVKFRGYAARFKRVVEYVCKYEILGIDFGLLVKFPHLRCIKSKQLTMNLAEFDILCTRVKEVILHRQKGPHIEKLLSAKLDVLKLKSCKISPYLLEIKVSSFRKLDLTANWLSEPVIDLSNTYSLCLHFNNIGETWTETFAKQLIGSPLKKLDISLNPIGEKGICNIMDALPSSCITTLDLSHIRVSLDCAKSFAALEKCKLQRLSMTGNELSSNFINAIKNYLAASKLSFLDLSFNKIDNNGCYSLFDVLPKMRFIQEIRLDANEIDVLLVNDTRCLPKGFNRESVWMSFKHFSYRLRRGHGAR